MAKSRGSGGAEFAERRRTILEHRSVSTKHCAANLKFSAEELFEYVDDFAKLLKSYVDALRWLEQNDLSAATLDGISYAITDITKRVVPIKTAHAERGLGIRKGSLDDAEVQAHTASELIEVMRGLELIKDVLFAYPPKG